LVWGLEWLEIERAIEATVKSSSCCTVQSWWYGEFAYAARLSTATDEIGWGALVGMDEEDLSFQIGLRVLLRTLEAGALGAEAEAFPSDHRDRLVGFATGATKMWQAILALSLTMTMLVGRESIKLEKADVIFAM
jgi:hypothetical protein